MYLDLAPRHLSAISLINTSLQRRYKVSACARNFLERQISKTRSDLERSERAVVAYAQQQRIIATVSSVGPDGQGRLKKTEILITPHESDEDQDSKAVGADS